MQLTLQKAYTPPLLPSDAELRHWAQLALADHTPDSLLIRITDRTESQALNHQYRGKNQPTNILSFPFVAPPGLPHDHLGDLVICAPVVTQEATDQHKPEIAHWAHLVIHGVLHLRGYDHQNPAEATHMETLECQMLHTLGYPNPYQL